MKVYNLIHKIDSDTIICHAITQSFAMGSISPRDFIDIVHFKCYEGNVNVISSISVDFPGYPPTSHYIRGYNHGCGFVCSPLKDNPAHSKLVMFVQTEMRGKLSPSIIEATMPSNLVNVILNARDGIKTHKALPERGYHNFPSLHKKKWGCLQWGHIKSCVQLLPFTSKSMCISSRQHSCSNYWRYSVEIRTHSCTREQS